MDDGDLKYVHPPRKDSIGACSAPYGPARVEVYDAAAGGGDREDEGDEPLLGGGLAPDTEYTYKVFVKGEAVGGGRALGLVRRATSALVQTGRPVRQPVPHAPGSENDCGVAVLRGDWRLRRRRQGRQPDTGASSRWRTRCGSRSTTKACGSC